MMDEIDEYHELCMRARDEMRPLTDMEIAIQGDIYYEVQRSKYEMENRI
jgi:hypothetical protein